MSAPDFARLGVMSSVAEFLEAAQGLALGLPCDLEVLASPAGPLSAPVQVGGRRLTNRFAVQPMEGWDGTPDGRPTDLTVRRWQRFGESGAKLIWGGEAVAVRHDGRANPHQLLLNQQTASEIGGLRNALLQRHRELHGEGDPPLVGLQLTHSGRYCRPNDWGTAEPWIAYRHPILDARLGVDLERRVLTDAQLDDLVDDYALAAAAAAELGFDFIDLKACHGYLGHELLGAHTRQGAYGGGYLQRTRFLRGLVAAVQAAAPALMIGVRLSAFDTVPYRPDPERSRPGKPGPGIPELACEWMPYHYGFGVDPDQPTEIDLAEPLRLVRDLADLGVALLNVTGGSPYYNPHLQRPALYPPSDGYQPPEDPLVGVARHLHVTRAIKAAEPRMVVVGTGYSYLQEFLPNVAQAVVREEWTDFVGLGRSVLSYPGMAVDLLAGRPIDRKRICRTFSDCTTGPRNRLPSGCYPLDPLYRTSTDGEALARAKREAAG